MTFNVRYLNLPPFCFEIRTDISKLAANLHHIYGDALSCTAQIPDYYLTLSAGSGLRKYIRPQARFLADQQEPFKPIEIDNGFALLEWGMNWCIATSEMRFVIVHAAVLAKDGKAVLFPAPPGSGKSTLTAWLAFNGWRLLSDEMALLIPGTNRVIPFVRPICLKNQSIDLARSWFPEARFSSVAKNTHKGDVVHLSPPAQSWLNNKEAAEVVAIVFPKYNKAQQLEITALSQAQAFMALAENAFNFSLAGAEGFHTIVKLVEQCQNYEVTYSQVAELAEFLQQDVLPYAHP